MTKQDSEHNIEEADIQAARSQFLGVVYDEKTFSFTAEQFAEFSRACGETAPRYTDPGHPDFQAPPTFPTSLHPNKRMPDGYPKFNGLGMDAGKAVSPIRPIKAGETKEVAFTLPFAMLKSSNDRLKEKGGALGAIGSIGAFANNEKSEYFVDADVDVKSAALDPSDKKQIKLV